MELAEFRLSIRTLIQDSGGQFFEDAELDAALAQALLDYGEANPHGGSAVIGLTGEGILPLAGLPAGAHVVRVYYPWNADLPLLKQENNQVLIWEEVKDGTALGLETSGADLPQTGSSARVHYLTPHTVAGLNGATETSVPEIHAGVIVRGAAAYAMLSGSADRSEVLDRPVLEHLGQVLMEGYRLLLDEVMKSTRRAGSAILQWRGMDKFEFLQ